MLNRAEFDIGSKVNFWNGKKFVKAAITNINLNPIENIIEYRLFYREGTDTGKRSRVHLTTTPMFIKESKYFEG